MPTVDVRWRPSGGRGEYEHVPQEVLLGRRIVVKTIAIPGANLTTDASGTVRDGKPRIRRDDPNDRSVLNVPRLVAALALLPDPIREDKGEVALPLREKAYVVSSITFDVDLSTDGVAICTPLRLRVLHDTSEVDLVSRLYRVGELLGREGLPAQANESAKRYASIVRGGVPLSELLDVSSNLQRWLDENPEVAQSVDAPSDEILSEPAQSVSTSVTVEEVSVPEARRRLVSHFAIDRSRKIRNAKVAQFSASRGRVYCENCSFDFESKYGDRGAGFIEVHHLVPLAAILPNSLTRLADLMLLCANCHRMVHRRLPLLSAEGLRATTRLPS